MIRMILVNDLQLIITFYWKKMKKYAFKSLIQFAISLIYNISKIHNLKNVKMLKSQYM